MTRTVNVCVEIDTNDIDLVLEDFSTDKIINEIWSRRLNEDEIDQLEKLVVSQKFKYSKTLDNIDNEAKLNLFMSQIQLIKLDDLEQFIKTKYY